MMPTMNGRQLQTLSLMLLMLTTTDLKSPATLPLVDPSPLNMRHNAFLAELLMEEVDMEPYQCNVALPYRYIGIFI